MAAHETPSPRQRAPFGTENSPLWEHDESEDEPFIEVIGSLNIDLVTRTKRMPRAGETLMAQSFSAGFGGKGANQAVACARLVREKLGGPAKNGTIVHMVGAVGGGGAGVDIGAQSYLDHLLKEGVDPGHVLVKDNVPTGTAVIVVEEDTGENRILITPGANGAIQSAGELQLDNFPGGVVMFQLEIPIPIVRRVLTILRLQFH